MIALGGAGVVAVPASATSDAGPVSAKLVHHVFFWLRNAGSAEDREQLIAGIRKLAVIDVVRGLHIGVPAPTEDREVVDSSYDVSELLFFDSVADQKTYQDHPVHKAFVANCSHLWRKVVVYDTLSV
ncbi:Dabb family protein [Sphingomonas gilva]|uniref:Dabb family protein n=2 Tax=Sphingomonas gilva TaxID=2305907 RepID=A0A396RM91_9SPHN|nr:Dabb family protein [Sphingomonas gilva]